MMRQIVKLMVFLLLVAVVLVPVCCLIGQLGQMIQPPVQENTPPSFSFPAQEEKEEQEVLTARQVVECFAAERGIDLSEYPESLLSLLERNPETEDFVLHYPLEKDSKPNVDMAQYANSPHVPLLMQWDRRWGYIPYGDDVAGLTGCGPVCLAMAGFYVTGDSKFSPDKILAFAKQAGYCVPGNGTAWTLISEGGKTLGLDVTEIPLDKNRIFVNLDMGNPIICVMGPGDFTSTGHYIVLAGTQEGFLVVNDPNSNGNSQRLWSYEAIKDQIRNLWVIRAKG